jgi:hypothetical protein
VLTEHKLSRVLEYSKLLSEANRKLVLDIFYDAVKLIYYKQKHNKKPQLKSKEVARCLNLIYYHHKHDNKIEVKDGLAENMGREFSEQEALEYYQNRVMGTVKDTLGQDVLIDEMGMDFLYEDHDIKPEHYRQARGKRLPWIRHVIKNSKEIYTKQERNTLLYVYVSKFMIRFNGQENLSWFLVFAKKRKDIDKTLAFLTAIPVERYNGFLSKLESMHPASV